MTPIEEFTNTIALEAHTLENIFARESDNYFSSASLLGKPVWYSVGLESNDDEQARDNNNKQGIVRRMVDAILNFIKRVIARVKKFFTPDSTKKQDTSPDKEENSNNDAFQPPANLKKFVEGEEDETQRLQLVRTALRFELENRNISSSEKLQIMAWTLSKIKDLYEPYVEKAFAKAIDTNRDNWTEDYCSHQFVFLKTNFSLKRCQHLVDVVEHLNTTEKMANREKQRDRAIAHLSESRLSQFYVLATTNFVRYIDNTFHLSSEVRAKNSNSENFTKNEKYIVGLDDMVNSCNETLKHYDETPDKNRLEKVLKFILNEDKEQVEYVQRVCEKSLSAIKTVTSALEETSKVTESLRNESSSAALEQLKNIQRMTSSLTAHLLLLIKFTTICADATQFMSTINNK